MTTEDRNNESDRPLAERFGSVIERMLQRERRVIKPIPTLLVGRVVVSVDGQGYATAPCKVWHKDGLALMMSEDPQLTITATGSRAIFYLPPPREPLGWDVQPLAFWPERIE